MVVFDRPSSGDRDLDHRLRANAHNDYLYERPLLDALNHGFCSVKEGKVEMKAVTVIISGNRPWERIEADSTRYAGASRLTSLYMGC